MVFRGNYAPEYPRLRACRSMKPLSGRRYAGRTRSVTGIGTRVGGKKYGFLFAVCVRARAYGFRPAVRADTVNRVSRARDSSGGSHSHDGTESPRFAAGRRSADDDGVRDATGKYKTEII